MPAVPPPLLEAFFHVALAALLPVAVVPVVCFAFASRWTRTCTRGMLNDLPDMLPDRVLFEDTGNKHCIPGMNHGQDVASNA